MSDSPIRRPRRSIEINVRESLLEEAQRLNIDVGEACEAGLKERVSAAWIEENREAIESCNRWVEQNGLPLEHYRQF